MLARSLGARAELAEATDALNRYQVERVLGTVEARLIDSGPSASWVLSYKPDTSVVEESQGVALVERLLDRGRRVIAYDPKALAAAQLALRRPFETAASAADCVRGASLVVDHDAVAGVLAYTGGGVQSLFGTSDRDRLLAHDPARHGNRRGCRSTSVMVRRRKVHR